MNADSNVLTVLLYSVSAPHGSKPGTCLTIKTWMDQTKMFLIKQSLSNVRLSFRYCFDYCFDGQIVLQQDKERVTVMRCPVASAGRVKISRSGVGGISMKPNCKELLLELLTKIDLMKGPACCWYFVRCVYLAIVLSICEK